MYINIRLQKQLAFSGKIFIYCVLLISLYVLGSWLFNADLLIRLSYFKTPMNPLTAIAFILVAGSFAILMSPKVFLYKNILNRSIAVLVILIGVIVLLWNITGIDLSIDTFLFHKAFAKQELGRMSAHAALCFVMYGLIILFFDFRPGNKKHVLYQYLAIIPAFIGAFTAINYLIHAGSFLLSFTKVPMSFLAAICNILLPLAILFARPDRGFVAELTKTTTGVKGIIYFIPALLLLPVFFSYLHFNTVYFSTNEGFSLMVVCLILFSIYFINHNLRIVNTSILKRQKTLSELKTSLMEVKNLSDLISLSSDAIVTIDFGLKIIQWNKGAEKIYGYSAKEAIGENVYELLYSEQFTKVAYNKSVADLILSGEHTTIQELKNKSGKHVTVYQSSIATKDFNGKIMGFVSIAKDLTEIVEKENQLKLLNESLEIQVDKKVAELNDVYNRITDGVLSLDTSFNLTYYNDSALRTMLQYRPSGRTGSLLHQNFFEELPFLNGSLLHDACKKALAGQVVIRQEMYDSFSDIWTSQSIYPSNEGLSIFFVDITQDKKNELQLNELQESYKRVLDTAQEGIVIYDENGILTYANKRMEIITELPVSELLGKQVLHLFHDSAKEKVAAELERRKQGVSGNYEVNYQSPNGIVKTWKISASPSIVNGVIINTLVMITDITDKKKIENDLVYTNQLYNALSQVTRLLVHLKTKEELFDHVCGIIVNTAHFRLAWIGLVNENMDEIKVDYTRGEAISYLNDFHITLKGDVANLGPTATAIITGQPYIVNDFFADPKTLPWQQPASQNNIAASAALPIKFNQQVIGALSVYASEKDYFNEKEINLLNEVVHAITVGLEKLAKDTELKKLTGELRSLSSYLQNIREEERKNIAKDIHDELGQNLTALKFAIAWVGSHFVDTDTKKIKERIEEAKTLADDTIQTSRRLYNSLYPRMLEDVGLVETVKWHVSSYAKNSQFIVNIQNNIVDDQAILHIKQPVSLLLFRIYQECFTNIMRYAQATQVEIHFSLNNHRLILEIKDDGVGFEPDKVDTTLHHGLLGMRERVNSLKGTLTIKSSPGKGTITIASMPVA